MQTTRKAGRPHKGERHAFLVKLSPEMVDKIHLLAQINERTYVEVVEVVATDVLDDTGAPIPGLYGVGNCVASPSGRAYWAGGATLGPIIAFAYRAAQAAHLEPARQLVRDTAAATA